METNILLESGTNELELLEFIVGTNNFGINIAKVSEMMNYRELTPMPISPECVEGVFMPRDKLITVIDLHKVLKIPQPENQQGMLILCEFNQMDIAFHVTNVKGMRRISWSSIEKPPAAATGDNSGIVTGIAKIEGTMILILDFEKIVGDINSSAGLDIRGVDQLHPEENHDVDFTKHIVIAEDSPFLNKMIMDTLHTSGFKNVISFPNGVEAWDYISSFKNSSDITSEVAILISDIEMPQMDGHHLTKRIKDDPVLKKIPVFLFSSLIDDKMHIKGVSVGADEQFSKPQIGALIEKLYEYLRK